MMKKEYCGMPMRIAHTGITQFAPENTLEAFRKTAALYKELKAAGVCEELLGYVLLSGNTLSITSTMNARELKLFLKLRTCRRAQWEIQDLSVELLKGLREISPEIFSKFGPSCYCDGFCPEGRLTCGSAKEMREFFSTL